MELLREMALIEAVLFLESDPVEIKTIKKITDLPEDLILKALEKLEEKYKFRRERPGSD